MGRLGIVGLGLGHVLGAATGHLRGHLRRNGLRLDRLVARRGEDLRGELRQFTAQKGILLGAGLRPVEFLLRP